jgi:4-nitrophenol 2-monooxygenase / 4-nitrocatechol 4-monooxygenase, reductase component
VTSTSGTVSPDEAVVEQQIFRDVIGRFASGVTVITTSVADSQFGTTASAVSSLSVDPPMLLVCLNKTSETQAAVLEAGCFCVNILAEGQEELAYQFAKKGDKFADISFDHGRNGSPVLQGSLAHLECEVHETVTGVRIPSSSAGSPSPPAAREPRSPTSAADSAGWRASATKRPTRLSAAGSSPARWP